MDDLKLYDKTMKKIDSLLQTVRSFSSYIEMQFGNSKTAMLEMKKGKVVQSEGIELPNGETIKSLEDEKGYKHLSVF